MSLIPIIIKTIYKSRPPFDDDDDDDDDDWNYDDYKCFILIILSFIVAIISFLFIFS